MCISQMEKNLSIRSWVIKHQKYSNWGEEVLHFLKLKGKTLISVGKFCNRGFKAVFTKTESRIEKYGRVYLKVNIYNSTWLWDLELKNISILENNAYELQNKKVIISFLYKAAFSPVPKMWRKDINAGFLQRGQD